MVESALTATSRCRHHLVDSDIPIPQSWHRPWQRRIPPAEPHLKPPFQHVGKVRASEAIHERIPKANQLEPQRAKSVRARTFHGRCPSSIQSTLARWIASANLSGWQPKTGLSFVSRKGRCLSKPVRAAANEARLWRTSLCSLQR